MPPAGPASLWAPERNPDAAGIGQEGRKRGPGTKMRAQAQADTERGEDLGGGSGPGGDRSQPPRPPHPRAPTMRGVLAPCGGPREPPVGRGASLWAPREEPGSRPSPAGQLAARGPGRSAPDENANLQLAGALNKSGETKQAEAAANPSLGCFQNKREGGARRRRVPARDRGSQGAPRPPPRRPARPAPPAR